ncbi:MAG TPA: peptide-N-glycosidase F-related protein [Candidatus Kapabacteria bacterium]|nr:peptide-N-glycosidase F-related protein [Candidatus Kapabacteria bacterium]
MGPRYRLLLLSFATLTALALAGPLAEPLAAAPGDTIRVRAFDSLLWKNHGGENRWVSFPDTTKRYEKILMHFRLKCPTGGCGEWDYTMSVYAQRRTGAIDSALQPAPSMRIDGAVRDSVPISLDTTWRTRYNAVTGKHDSTVNVPMRVVYYGDPLDAWRATDSTIVWPAGYWNYIYGAAGARLDSVWVTADSILRVTSRDVYVRFDVVDPVEIGRFITPYGKWFRAGREFDWVYDVTDYASLLRDSVEIRTFYDGWSQGSIYTLDFELIEGTPARDVFRVENIYTGGFTYGDPANSIENRLPETTITVDPRSTNTTLKITTSGHGFGGTDNAGEFADKTHVVKVNGQQRYTQRLWREDCGQNPVYPQAGTWYYQRAGWCPGDIVYPDFFDLTPFVTPGQTATVDYDMQPYVNEDLSKPASYFIHTQVLYASGPSFTNNVAIEEIRRPSTDFRFHRMNPICADAAPVIVLRNRGGATLTRAVITYGVDGGAQSRYDWTGSLAFMKTAEVELPALALGTTAGRFVATITEPNGAADEYPRDNAMTVAYEVPERSSGRLFLSLTTDDFFDDPATTNGIAWQVVNTDGQVFEARDGFDDRTIYRDTIELAPGCYQFVITDDYFGDGLIPIRGTAGRYSLRDDSGKLIANGASNGEYLASFGDREVTSFVVTSSTGVATPSRRSALEALTIFPNPSSGRFTIDLAGAARAGVLSLTVTSLTGARILETTIDASESTHAIDLSAQPAGTYLVRVDGDGESWLRKVIVEQR